MHRGIYLALGFAIFASLAAAPKQSRARKEAVLLRGEMQESPVHQQTSASEQAILLRNGTQGFDGRRPLPYPDVRRPLPYGRGSVNKPGSVQSTAVKGDLGGARGVTDPIACDTVYTGRSDGAWQLALNWTMGLPRPEGVACVIEGSVDWIWELDLAALPFALKVIPPSLAKAEPPERSPARSWYVTRDDPSTFGACCVQSQCSLIDAFECRELGGYLIEGAAVCDLEMCNTGACCTPEPACYDAEDWGFPVVEGDCALLDGVFVGGAQCDETDPCQPHRIPLGFEILEVANSPTFLDIPYHINDCGQIVYTSDNKFLDTSEIMLYENGATYQLTNNNEPDGLPDINRYGTVAWTRDPDSSGTGGGEVMRLLPGSSEELIGGGTAPSINDAGHMAWYLVDIQSCAIEGTEYFFDGQIVRTVFDDGMSNQSVELNDLDEMVWHRYDFCVSPWESDILRSADGTWQILPSFSSTSFVPQLNNQGQVVWRTPGSLELWQGDPTEVLIEETVDNPDINERGTIPFNQKQPMLAWTIRLLRDGQFFFISRPEERTIRLNIRPKVNEHDELVWHWDPGSLEPSGVMHMRRIRNGDADLDLDVDFDDFVLFSKCMTGPGPFDGLCECRFLDIDHDRDIDGDDFNYFIRTYTGPEPDCNENTTSDLGDIVDGTSQDCNYNGTPDECDIAEGSSADDNTNAIPDECDCPALQPPLPDDQARDLGFGAANRYLSFIPNNPDREMAIRVTFDDLPGDFAALNGQSMWLSAPYVVSENSADSGSGPWPNFTAATLGCQPTYRVWDPLTTLRVFGEPIVPGGNYTIEAVDEFCSEGLPGVYSETLAINTSTWGDMAGNCAEAPCSPPNGVADFLDIGGMVEKFRNLIGSLPKFRSDIAPSLPDQVIDFIDISHAVDAFRTIAYPFDPPTPCPQ